MCQRLSVCIYYAVQLRNKEKKRTRDDCGKVHHILAKSVVAIMKAK
ncbi:MAG: hypothetical protein IJS52_02000 [Bacilli bacterium]|nr:hypothetical protein [Bacilli bacterium]